MRRCTDVLCVLIFACCLGLLTWILVYSNQNGDLRKIHNGFDYEGNLCGVDKSEKYLFYCQQFQNGAGTTVLDFARPICVSTCPTDGTVHMLCPGGNSLSYETKPVGGLYCVPTNQDMVAQIRDALSTNQYIDILPKLEELQQVWLALLIAACIAIVLGYIYLFALDWLAKPIVWLGSCILVIIPALVGGYLIWVAKFDGSIEGVPDVAIGTNDQTMGVGIGLLVLSALLICCLLCSTHSVDTAIHCIEAACECIFAEPSLVIVPVLEITLKALCFVGMALGFMVVLSTGDVTSRGGMYRDFEFSDLQKCYLAFYAFMMVWVLELMTSWSQFAIAYGAQAWYFTPYENGHKRRVPPCAVFTGYFLGATCHIGSLIFGSFLIATLRVIRMIMEFFVAQMKATGNKVGEVIAKVCVCCLTCFEKTVAFCNKNAYIEMAISGDNFCTSSMSALGILVGEAGAVGILNGATFLLQVVGIGAIAAIGGVISFFMCEYASPFNDINSVHFVSDPMFVAGTAALISGVFALSFMIVFDTVSDTMLMCYGSKKDADDVGKSSSEPVKRPGGSCGASFFNCGSTKKDASKESLKGKPEYAPPGLRSLLAEHRSNE